MTSWQYDGFWAEIGSLKSFYDINLALAMPDAPLSVDAIHRGILSRGLQRPSCCILCGVPSLSGLIVPRATMLFGALADASQGQPAWRQGCMPCMSVLYSVSLSIHSAMNLGSYPGRP